MKKQLLLTVVAIIVFLSTVSTEIGIEKSDFCKKCDCNKTDNVVTCHNIKFDTNMNISTTNFWSNSDTNETYPFYKVSVQGAGIRHILPLPESPVRILDLSSNNIEVLENGCFMYLQNMTELDLSKNDLQSEMFSPDIFKGLYTEDEYLPLKSLKVLRLATNNLHTLHQDIFEHIMNLEILDLHGNPLRVIDTQTLIAISGLRYLRTLDLSYTHLKKIPDHIFHTPRNLTSLDLTGNLLTKVPTNQLEDAHNLKFLSLNENPIINITKKDGFPKLEHLKILHLCYMDNLTRIEEGSLSGLWNVEELHISNNQLLTHIDNKALVRTENGAESQTWPLVKKLYLKNNKLTFLSHEFLARWDSLEEIDITDNAWTCTCENQWLIETLVKFIVNKNDTHRHHLWCASPQELEGKSMEEIYLKNETLRCLDMYGGHPEKDAGILIGILIGLLTGIPLVLGLLFCYKKQFFGYFSPGPAAFSRKFYNPANSDEEFNS